MPDNTFAKIYDIVRQIPCGKVATYGQIARILGCPRGGRHVGFAMRACPEDLNWQRVVMKDGSITGGGHAEIRRGLLEAEDVIFTPDGRVDMERCKWAPENL